MWYSLVAIVRITVFSAAHLCGGSRGGGILLATSKRACETRREAKAPQDDVVPAQAA